MAEFDGPEWAQARADAPAAVHDSRFKIWGRRAGYAPRSGRRNGKRPRVRRAAPGGGMAGGRTVRLERPTSGPGKPSRRSVGPSDVGGWRRTARAATRWDVGRRSLARPSPPASAPPAVRYRPPALPVLNDGLHALQSPVPQLFMAAPAAPSRRRRHQPATPRRGPHHRSTGTQVRSSSTASGFRSSGP